MCNTPCRPAADPAARAAIAAQHPRLTTLKARYDQRDYVIMATGSTSGPAGHGSTLASALCEVNRFVTIPTLKSLNLHKQPFVVKHGLRLNERKHLFMNLQEQ